MVFVVLILKFVAPGPESQFASEGSGLIFVAPAFRRACACIYNVGLKADATKASSERVLTLVAAPLFCIRSISAAGRNGAYTYFRRWVGPLGVVLG